MPAPKNFEDALYNILVNTSGIGSKVSTRIYPDRAPDGTVTDYIVFQLVTGNRDQSHDSAASLTTQRFQIDCMSATPAGAKWLASLVKDALHGYTGTPVGGGVTVQYCNAFDGPSGFSETTKVYRRIVEIVAMFAEP